MLSFCVPTAKKCLRKRFGRLVKSVLVLSTVTFWGRLFFWRFFFCNIENKFYASWQKKLSEVVKTSFYESRRSLFSIEKLENAQKVSFLVLTPKNCLRTSWLKICCFNFSGKLKKNIMPFAKRNLAKLSKNHFTCPVDVFSH